MARCRILAKTNRQLYEELEEELEQTFITVASANSSHLCNRSSRTQDQPILSLAIPNKLYLLWGRKVELQRKLGKTIYTQLELCNHRIAGAIRLQDTILIKERLRKQSIR